MDVSNTGLVYTSDQLQENQVYTREDLKQQYGITDATINTGIFQPAGTKSVWIFITEKKTADRTQYVDKLDGDVLYCQGQIAGRKDHLYIQQKDLDLELLVFYRTEKYEHPGAGFRYLGLFDYESHSGFGPTSFVLRHANPKGRI